MVGAIGGVVFVLTGGGGDTMCSGLHTVSGSIIWILEVGDMVTLWVMIVLSSSAMMCGIYCLTLCQY